MEAIVVLITIVILLWVCGYVFCIFRLCRCKWDPIGKPEIIYSLAILTGLAGIVGYIKIE